MAILNTDYADANLGLKTTLYDAIKPALTTGEFDKTKSDYLNIKVNDTEIASNVRSVELNVGNDNSAYTLVWPEITGKGNVGVFIPFGAAAPTWAAYMEGALYYDSAAHKLMVATNAAWVVAGSQS